jgi:hypothetical protein
MRLLAHLLHRLDQVAHWSFRRLRHLSQTGLHGLLPLLDRGFQAQQRRDHCSLLDLQRRVQRRGQLVPRSAGRIRIDFPALLHEGGNLVQSLPSQCLVKGCTSGGLLRQRQPDLLARQFEAVQGVPRQAGGCHGGGTKQQTHDQDQDDQRPYQPGNTHRRCPSSPTGSFRTHAGRLGEQLPPTGT